MAHNYCLQARRISTLDGIFCNERVNRDLEKIIHRPNIVTAAFHLSVMSLLLPGSIFYINSEMII